MSLAIDSYCIQCYLRRNVELVRPLGSEEKTTRFAKAIMRMYLEAPETVSAPWFGPQVADLMHEMYGIEYDRFRQEKIDSNRFVMSRMEQIRTAVETADDPILAGLQMAILGNYLDYSAFQGNVSFDTLDDMMSRAREMVLDEANVASFRRDLERGRKLLYITDNAGEIGFDRVYAEAIAKRYPNLDITFCVRGAVTQNDATRADAAAVGLPFRLIDNGNRIAGTQIDQLSEEAKQALDSADVILSKGMANTETMFGCGYNVYYAFLVKCHRFVQIFDKPMMTPMFIRDGQK